MFGESLKNQFSLRLKELMLQRGYTSNSSATGVKTTALRNGIGTSAVMALRYLNGTALPDIETVLKIASWLKVNPTYLLFGDESNINNNSACDIIRLNKALLEHVINIAFLIAEKVSNKAQMGTFFTSILSDLSSLQVDLEKQKAIFDLALKPSLSLAGIHLLTENCHEGRKNCKEKSSKTA